jgi:predicted ribosome quality control (RQC) complex YloA/Tae2 family protein
MVQKYIDTINFENIATNTLMYKSNLPHKTWRLEQLNQRWLWGPIKIVMRSAMQQVYFSVRPAMRPLAHRLRRFLLAEIQTDLARMTREFQAETRVHSRDVRNTMQNELRDLREAIERIERMLEKYRIDE